jgi:hypothetical protein
MLVSIMAQVDHTSYLSSDCIRGVSPYILCIISPLACVETVAS